MTPAPSNGAPPATVSRAAVVALFQIARVCQTIAAVQAPKVSHFHNSIAIIGAVRPMRVSPRRGIKKGAKGDSGRAASGRNIIATTRKVMTAVSMIIIVYTQCRTPTFHVSRHDSLNLQDAKRICIHLIKIR